jgi:hypothetical protein
MFIKVRGKELWKMNPKWEEAHRPPDMATPEQIREMRVKKLISPALTELETLERAKAIEHFHNAHRELLQCLDLPLSTAEHRAVMTALRKIQDVGWEHIEGDDNDAPWFHPSPVV